MPAGTKGKNQSSGLRSQPFIHPQGSLFLFLSSRLLDPQALTFPIPLGAWGSGLEKGKGMRAGVLYNPGPFILSATARPT